MKKTTQEKNNPEPSSTRWWESYAVRYFIGFVAGSICITILAINLGIFNSGKEVLAQIISSTNPNSPAKPDWTILFLTILLLGFAYCYIASTPITVLHFGRYGHGLIDSHSRHFWFGWVISIIVLALFGTAEKTAWMAFFSLALAWGWIGSLINPISPQYELENAKTSEEKEKAKKLEEKTVSILIKQSIYWFLIIFGLHNLLIFAVSFFKPNITKPEIQALWLFSAPVLWIGLSQYFVLIRLFKDQEKIYAFYANLFNARRQENAKDIRDSYSHLREHSNAVFIVVVEISILSYLLALHWTLADNNIEKTLPSIEYLKLVFIGTAVWMVPTVFLWGRANAFEKAFSRNPKRFIK